MYNYYIIYYIVIYIYSYSNLFLTKLPSAICTNFEVSLPIIIIPPRRKITEN